MNPHIIKTQITPLPLFWSSQIALKFFEIPVCLKLDYHFSAKRPWMYSESHSRSSHQRCSVRKGVLRNLAKLIGKHLCQSLSFNKVAGSAQFCEISKNTFFTERHWATASVIRKKKSEFWNIVNITFTTTVFSENGFLQS